MQYVAGSLLLLPLIGFSINSDKVRPTSRSTPVARTRSTPASRSTPGSRSTQVFRTANTTANTSETGTYNTSEKEIFNEMGQILNDKYSMEAGKVFVDTTTFKNREGSTERPFMPTSLRRTDENGLSENFGSYKDNFPYDSSQSKNIEVETHLQNLNLVNKFKKQSNLSSILLPKGVTDYLEVYDINQKIKKMSEEKFPAGKDKLILSAPQTVVQRHQYSMGVEKIDLNYSDNKLDQNFEIKVKSKPNLNLFLLDRDNVFSKDNKSSVFYTVVIDDSFNLQKQPSASLLDTYNLKN